MRGVRLPYPPTIYKRMKPTRDASRRNRNIGTAKQGHGQNNRLAIPVRFNPTVIFFYENLLSYKSVIREIENRKITFLIEHTRADCLHACTIDDLVHILGFIPPTDLKGIDLIVLRQPKRKEEILNAAWGRWVPCVTVEDFSGCAIFLEAVPCNQYVRWPKALSLEKQKELRRLESDGHEVVITKKHYQIKFNLEPVRATQLYRTLLHEIGHHVDFQRDPIAFDQKANVEKEVFAHRYADELRARLMQQQVLPFPRKLSTEQIEKDGLRVTDFVAI